MAKEMAEVTEVKLPKLKLLIHDPERATARTVEYDDPREQACKTLKEFGYQGEPINA